MVEVPLYHESNIPVHMKAGLSLLMAIGAKLRLTLGLILIGFHIIASVSVLAADPEPLYTESLDKKKFIERAIHPFSLLTTLDPKLSTEGYLDSSFFHRATVEKRAIKHFVDDYLRYHTINRWTGTKYLIYQPWGAGGLGDRCHILMDAYWLAVLSRRMFLIDWEEPFSASVFLKNANRSGLNMFYNHSHDFPRGVTARVDKNTPYVSFLTAERGNELSGLTDEQTLMSSKQTVVYKWNNIRNFFTDKLLDFNRPRGLSRQDLVAIRGSWRLRRVFYNQVFSLSNQLIGRYFSEANDLGIYRTPYIAVHARIGQGVGEVSARFHRAIQFPKIAARCLAKRAIALAQGFENRYADNPLPVFLATDTPGFRQTFVNVVTELSNRKVRVVSGNWDVMHTNRLYGRPKNVSEQVVLDGLVDLTMLGHAQHIVAFYSSFARLALTVGQSETLTELRNDVCFDDLKTTSKPQVH